MRFFKILNVFLEYFVFYRLNRHSRKILGKRIKEACEKLGTTFIKLGQILSTRYDLLWESDCFELQKLLDDTTQIPIKKIREIIKHDFGKYPEELFDEFETDPLASASISQVHRAVLDGEKVVVKVKRPYIGKIIEEDMKVISFLANTAKLFSPTLRTMNIGRVVDDMRLWLLQEIDFINEKKNIMLLRKFAKSYDGKYFRKDLGRVIFPHTYKYCSKNVLTISFMDGVPLNKLHLVAGKEEYDAKLSLKTYINASTNSMFTKDEYFFQGDPHPANILVLKNGDVSNIDCGLIGYFNNIQLKKLRDLFLAVYSKNSDEGIKVILRMCEVDYSKYYPKIRKDFESYIRRTESEGIGFWFIELARVLIKHGVKFPATMILFGRMCIILDGLVSKVFHGKTTVDIMGKELGKGLVNEIVNNFKRVDYFSVLYKLSLKAKESPHMLSRLVDKYYTNPLKIVKDIRAELKI